MRGLAVRAACHEASSSMRKAGEPFTIAAPATRTASVHGRKFRAGISIGFRRGDAASEQRTNLTLAGRRCRFIVRRTAGSVLGRKFAHRRKRRMIAASARNGFVSWYVYSIRASLNLASCTGETRQEFCPSRRDGEIRAFAEKAADESSCTATVRDLAAPGERNEGPSGHSAE